MSYDDTGLYELYIRFNVNYEYAENLLNDIKGAIASVDSLTLKEEDSESRDLVAAYAHQDDSEFEIAVAHIGNNLVFELGALLYSRDNSYYSKDGLRLAANIFSSIMTHPKIANSSIESRGQKFIIYYMPEEDKRKQRSLLKKLAEYLTPGTSFSIHEKDYGKFSLQFSIGYLDIERTQVYEFVKNRETKVRALKSEATFDDGESRLMSRNAASIEGLDLKKEILSELEYLEKLR